MGRNLAYAATTLLAFLSCVFFGLLAFCASIWMEQGERLIIGATQTVGREVVVAVCILYALISMLAVLELERCWRS